MRKILIPVVAGVLVLVVPASAATAGPKRTDRYYTVMCIDPDGQLVQAESVDGHAIEQGGKGGAIDNFNENHPGWYCWAEEQAGS